MKRMTKYLMMISASALFLDASAHASGTLDHNSVFEARARAFEPPDPCRWIKARGGNACGLTGKFHRSGGDPSTG